MKKYNEEPEVDQSNLESQIQEEENPTELDEDNNVNKDNISKAKEAASKNGRKDEFLNDWS